MLKNTHKGVKALETCLDFLNKNGTIKITSCYNVVFKNKWQIKERCIEDFHLLFVKEGSCLYSMNDDELFLKKGDLLLVSGLTPHRALKLGESALSILPIKFRFYDMNNTLFQPLPPNTYICLRTLRHHIYLETLEKIYNSYSHNDNYPNSNIPNVLLQSLMIHLLLDLESLEENTYDIPIEKLQITPAITAIEKHPEKHYTLEELCSLCRLSKKYFSTLFKSVYKETPIQYQIRNRINYAKYMLENTSFSIKYIALELGYKDPYIFSKQFKIQTGLSPSEYKKNTIL